MKLYKPSDWAGNITGEDFKNEATQRLQEDTALLHKFFKRYPEIKMMPFTGPLLKQNDGHYLLGHPASKFIRQVYQLRKQGYSDQKAFDIVGKQIEEVL